MMARLQKVSDEVYIASDQIVRLGIAEVAFLREQALANERGRARICAHRTSDDPLHEMLIAIAASSYIHPHRHTGKSESFHVVEGAVDVVVFDEAGEIADVVELGDASTGKSFYYRLADSLFHTLLIHGDVLILHEVTNGPFRRDEATFADFAPAESDRAAARRYLRELRLTVAARRPGRLANRGSE